MDRLWEVHDGSRLQNRTAIELEVLKSHIGRELAMAVIVSLHRFYRDTLERTLGSLESRWESPEQRPVEGPKSTTIPSRLLQDLHLTIERHLQMTVAIVRETSFRVAGMTVGWMAAAFFVSIGLVDGLVRREVRRWSGGRESSWIYNTSSRLLRPVTMTYTVFLIAWPWTLNIAWTIAIFASLNGLLLSIASARFKKYL